MHVQIDGVTVPVTPGTECKPPARNLETTQRNASRRTKLFGRFLDAVIVFAVFAAADGWGRFAATVWDDVRTLAGV